MVFDQQLEDAHRLGSKNEESIRLSHLAGCFYCLEIFPANAVKDFLEEERTALCPRCGIDSVMGDASDVPINAEFLKRMHEYWFEHGTVIFFPDENR